MHLSKKHCHRTFFSKISIVSPAVQNCRESAQHTMTESRLQLSRMTLVHFLLKFSPHKKVRRHLRTVPAQSSRLLLRSKCSGCIERRLHVEVGRPLVTSTCDIRKRPQCCLEPQPCLGEPSLHSARSTMQAIIRLSSAKSKSNQRTSY